jgi:hypothetical protein
MLADSGFHIALYNQLIIIIIIKNVKPKKPKPKPKKPEQPWKPKSALGPEPSG